MKKIRCSSLLFVILLSIPLMFSCSKGGFSGSSSMEEDDDNDDVDVETGDGIYDKDNNGEISEEEFDELKDQLGPVTFEVKRVERDCTKCSESVVFSLYKVDGSKVSDAVKEKSKVSVVFKGRQKDTIYTSGDGSHLCPLIKKNVILNMSINYDGQELDNSDTSILLGGRENNKTVWFGVADKVESIPHFHNIDSIITSMKCPKVKKLAIKGLCEDKNLDDPTLLRCWRTEGGDNTCPHKNNFWYPGSDNDYVIDCRTVKK